MTQPVSSQQPQQPQQPAPAPAVTATATPTGVSGTLTGTPNEVPIYFYLDGYKVELSPSDQTKADKFYAELKGKILASHQLQLAQVEDVEISLVTQSYKIKFKPAGPTTPSEITGTYRVSDEKKDPLIELRSILSKVSGRKLDSYLCTTTTTHGCTTGGMEFTASQALSIRGRAIVEKKYTFETPEMEKAWKLLLRDEYFGMMAGNVAAQNEAKAKAYHKYLLAQSFYNLVKAWVDKKIRKLEEEKAKLPAPPPGNVVEIRKHANEKAAKEQQINQYKSFQEKLGSVSAMEIALGIVFAGESEELPSNEIVARYQDLSASQLKQLQRIARWSKDSVGGKSLASSFFEHDGLTPKTSKPKKAVQFVKRVFQKKKTKEIERENEKKDFGTMLAGAITDQKVSQAYSQTLDLKQTMFTEKLAHQFAYLIGDMLNPNSKEVKLPGRMTEDLGAEICRVEAPPQTSFELADLTLGQLFYIWRMQQRVAPSQPVHLSSFVNDHEIDESMQNINDAWSSADSQRQAASMLFPQSAAGQGSGIDLVHSENLVLPDGKFTFTQPPAPAPLVPALPPPPGG